MKFRCLLLLALAGAGGLCPVAQAAEPLRLSEAVARALSANPELGAESAMLQAVQARAAREALAPPLVLGGEFENFAGSGSLRGIDAAETTLRISRLLELGGKRAARQALGAAESGQQRQRMQQLRIELGSRTQARFIEVLADQLRLQQAREHVALAERSRKAVADWVQAARNPDTDLRAAELALAEAQLEQEHAEHELASARMTLAASWGAAMPDFEAVEGDLQALPALADFDGLAARLAESPAQAALQQEAEVVAARRQLGVAQRSPDLNFSVGLRRIEGIDDQGLVLSMALPLGSRPRADYAIAEADAQVAAIAARREALRVESRQQLFATYQELRHARTEVETLRQQMLPTAEQALADSRRGFEAGRFSFQVLTQAQDTLFRLRERAIDAAARYHLLRVEVARLTAESEDTLP